MYDTYTTSLKRPKDEYNDVYNSKNNVTYTKLQSRKIIFWDLLILSKIFFPAQLKWSVIISNKHVIYEVPSELPNDLRLSILGNQERSRKSLNFTQLEPSAQSSF